MLACNALVLSGAAGQTFGDAAAVPRRQVAIVLGAGLAPDGGPSAMLAARVDAGLALLRAGRVRLLLFSGDNGTVEHNELAAMLNYALRRGAPRHAIALDYAGFDTYDSCYRARRIFAVSSAVVVTQDFHVARAVYLCRRQGIDAVGYGLPDWSLYGAGAMRGLELREILARTKAVLDADVTRPVPAVMGPAEQILRNS